MYAGKGRRIAAVTLAAAAIALGACGDGGPSGGGAGGTAIVGMRADFGGFNPVTTGDQYGVEVNNYALFTPLVQYDEELNVRPWLADSWQLQGDTAVVFNLRRDVRWHDGRPVTAEDVVFTFDLAKDPAAASLVGSAYLSEVESATATDSFTVRFRFARPHAQALEDFWWAPVPKHLLEGVAPAELRNAPFNRNPVGSGPFRFAEWRANERLVLEPNPDFPEGLGGPPAAGRVVFRIIPEPSTMFTELRTGGIDYDVPLTPEQAREIEEGGSIQLHSAPGKTYYYIGWNNQREPFTSAEVRRAMTLAIDREEIIEALLYGAGRLAVGPIPPWSPLYPEVEPLAHDPAEAGRLLDQAGWRDTNGDGVRDRGGQPLRFTLLTSDHPVNGAVAEVVQAHLRQVGVDAQIQRLEFQTVLAQHRARDFDAVLTNWVLDNFQVASAPMALLHSRFADVPNSSNRSGVAIPELDRLIDRGATTIDPEQARQVWGEMLEVVKREQPFTSLFWLDEIAASNERLSNVTVDARGELVGMAEWTVGDR